MFRPLSLGLALSMALPVSAPLLAAEPGPPQVSTSVRQVTTEPLRILQDRALKARQEEEAIKGSAAPAPEIREIPRLERPRPPSGGIWQKDPVVQSRPGTGPAMPAAEQNFEGQSNRDGVLPPDTVGDVGPAHYVQMVNLSLAIYDKTGTVLLGPVASNTFWASLGGICASNNDGDPIVLYDQGADRWLISQFALAFPDDFHECVAVSQTGDPTGAWHLYDFLASTTRMNDYPKFGVWPDGYYMSANDFDGATSAYAGTSVYAFERSQMLQGLPARMIRFEFAASAEPWAWMPADWDGLAAPPTGAPNPFVYLQDDAWGFPADALEIWNFQVDWTTPANSTFTLAANLPVAPFTGDLCASSRNCIPQPGGTAVDSISDRLMFRNQYRNFGSHQAMALNHTVDASGSDHAGVRWYELENTGAGWSIAQQGTYAPDAHHRWMGSVALDKDGNLALGYSVSSTTLHPSIAYAGRLVGDPANTLPQTETFLIGGGGSQSHETGRWGDYSAMNVDPVDDCTFWYTQEYYASDSSADWQTRIGSFRFPSCVSGPTGRLEGHVEAAMGPSIEGARITAGALETFTGVDGNYAFTVPVGTYDMTASAYGHAAATASGVPVHDGVTTTQDFVLTPLSPVAVCGTVTDGSGQGWPLYARIDIGGSPVGPVFTDPVTGQYCINLFEGALYSFEVRAMAGGYIPETRSFTLDTSATTQDFALVTDPGCTAPGYEFNSVLGEEFEDGVPPTGWRVIDHAGTGVVWDTASAWGDANYTGGRGEAATVNSDTAGELDYDTELRTPSLPGSATQLSYLANYQNYAGNDFLDLDLSTDAGSTWTSVLSWNEDHGNLLGLPGEEVNLDLTTAIGGAANYLLRWRYYDPTTTPDWDWYAQIDQVQVGSCNLIAGGGLVVGHVYDANTGDGVHNALVEDEVGHRAETFPTPDDSAREGEGFYVLFSLAGNRTLTASAPRYGLHVQDPVTVTGGGVVERDFSLPAALLSHLPPEIETAGLVDDTWTLAAVLTNDGGQTGNFSISEVNAPYVAPVATGPFAEHGRLVSPKHLNDLDARARYLSGEPPVTTPLAAGDVLQTWPTALPYAWGIGYNQRDDNLWLGNITAAGAGGEDADDLYLLNGTATGDRIDVSGWVGDFAADMTYNPFTGMLWQVNVGGDNCLHELDPATLIATGQRICPAFGTSERGLAYDPLTDSYYAGSWNDGVINHFAPDGTLLDSTNVGLPIAGLAYNPGTGHLFVAANGEVANGFADVYVLDVNAGYAVIGSFDIAGLSDYGQAGLEIDCVGNLWVVDKNTQTVIQAESGETGVCDWLDIPWLTVTPSSGSVAGLSDQALEYVIDTTGLTERNYAAHVRIENDSPYGAIVVPVSLTVAPGQAYYDDLAVDFGAQGLWHYNSSWNRLTTWNPGTAGLTGWVGGLAVDFDGQGLWNRSGSGWTQFTTWDPGLALSAWSGGLAVDFTGHGLWNRQGTTWTQLTSWTAEALSGWSGGLAADFGSQGLWNWDGTSWRRLTTWNPGAGGLATWSGGLAVDFDGNGLWSYDGTAWIRLTSWNPGGLGVWMGGLAVDFDANGLWNHNGTGWGLLTTWGDASGLGGWGGNLAVDFDGQGLWNWTGAVWNRLITWDPENLTAMELP